MKKITKLTCTFAVMAAALFALTGCSNPDPSAETSKPAVAYVISNTANSKPVDSSAPLIQDTMLDATSLDQLCKLGRKTVNVNGMDAAELGSLAADGV